MIHIYEEKDEITWDDNFGGAYNNIRWNTTTSICYPHRDKSLALHNHFGRKLVSASPFTSPKREKIEIPLFPGGRHYLCD